MNTRASKPKLKMQLRKIVQQFAHFLANYEVLPEGECAVGFKYNRNISTYMQCALSYMHNGNKKGYDKYRQKLLGEQTDYLEFLTELPDSDMRITVNDQLSFHENEGGVIEASRVMKGNYDTLVYFEAGADLFSLWK
jgi:hypothetical protein